MTVRLRWGKIHFKIPATSRIRDVPRQTYFGFCSNPCLTYPTHGKKQNNFHHRPYDAVCPPRVSLAAELLLANAASKMNLKEFPLVNWAATSWDTAVGGQRPLWLAHMVKSSRVLELRMKLCVTCSACMVLELMIQLFLIVLTCRVLLSDFHDYTAKTGNFTPSCPADFLLFGASS